MRAKAKKSLFPFFVTIGNRKVFVKFSQDGKQDYSLVSSTTIVQISELLIVKRIFLMIASKPLGSS